VKANDTVYTCVLTAIGQYVDDANVLIQELLVVHKEWKRGHKLKRPVHTDTVEDCYWRDRYDELWLPYHAIMDTSTAARIELEWSGPMFSSALDDMDYDHGAYHREFDTMSRAMSWAVLTMYEMWLEGYQPSTEFTLTCAESGAKTTVKLESMRWLWPMFESNPPAWKTH
jgi:hypothetical protein